MYDIFLKITGFDIEDYFRRFTAFITDQSQALINYYSGLVDTMDRDAFAEYKTLLEEADQVIGLFDLNSERFQTVDFWELMDFADEIKVKLETIGNFSKYARSAVSKESFTTNVTVETSLGYNETIEEAMTRLGSTDRDTDWVDTALTNSIIQEDYTPEGGLVINVTFKNNSKFFIDSVVDNPEGDKIKGKDIATHLEFVDDDLNILGFDDTLDQTLATLTGLEKNDNPEFPGYGVDKSLVVGMTFKTISLPSIIRQIYQTFSTDDIVKQIQITDTTFDQDSIRLDLNISIQSGEEQKRTLSVNGN